MNLAVETGEASAFETPELLAIPDDVLDGFYAAEPALEHYRLALTRVRRQKEHTLSHEGEALLAAAGQLGQAPDDIFSMLNDADMAFPDAVDSQGGLPSGDARRLYPPDAVARPNPAQVGV